MPNFDFVSNDFDCIGFDLDNTLAEYQIPALTKLIYDGLSEYLINNKRYAAEIFLKPLDLNFLQKGLALDLCKGNIVKLGCKGQVLRACHGTQILNKDKMLEMYGESGIWEEASQYASNPFQAWNGDLGSKIRCVLDNFDIPAALIFARAVDTKPNLSSYHQVWLDILDGLNAIYQKENLGNATSNFFCNVLNAPEKFIKKCPDGVVVTLRNLKKRGKTLFLITGSALDFANFTASNSIGPFWKDLFDIIVCYAKKPAFFSEDRPFVALDGEKENGVCHLKEDTHIVSQGNWKELNQWLAKKSKIEDPKCIYVGDNVIQDVLAPIRYSKCQAVCILGDFTNFNDSPTWGSYGSEEHEKTLWQAFMDDPAVVASMYDLSTVTAC